ncbi:MAG TPA: phosphoanhydride phosphorylase [Solibacterales bacterium]|nr:phosphoanhydride phosphorylase [Bryobacterales bacterium]
MPPAPSSNWLQRAIAGARKAVSLKAWRAVEAQHVVSTLRLTANDPARQDLLEHILEEHKPTPPPATLGLHYLLATPFRYPPLPGGSRFRAWTDPGVLYAALARRTACAEMGYWRWRFVRESEGLRGIAAAPQTLFQIGARGEAIDVQQPPFEQRASVWTSPADYGATQSLGRQARAEALALILYRSVRDPESGTCAAVLDPAALHPKRPTAQETWYLTVTPGGALWQRERERFAFDFA